MKDMTEYKEYYGSVYYNDGNTIFYGKIEYIHSLVTYEGIEFVLAESFRKRCR